VHLGHIGEKTLMLSSAGQRSSLISIPVSRLSAPACMLLTARCDKSIRRVTPQSSMALGVVVRSLRRDVRIRR
jgi:hypothetical protein